MKAKVKIVKRLFYILAALVILCSFGILICALNPGLTAPLAEKAQQLAEKRADSSGRGGDGTTSVDLPGLRPDKELGGDGAYNAPEQRPDSVPDDVSGRNGYRPVTEDAEQIPQEEADNLSSVIGTGDTGDTLSFQEEYYPYYAMLSENMKLLYKQIYANAQELNAAFSPIVETDVDSLKNVFEAVCNDHPELFWLETGYSCKYLKNGKCVEVCLQYNAAAEQLDVAKDEFERCAEAILAEARQLSTDLEKERYVHNALILLTEYDERADMGQSAYSALVTGKSVCAGYARAFQYCMQQLGIPTYYCTGYAGQDHAWDIVKLGNRYCNVDVTWDDTEPATENYFNKTDAEFASTHMRTGLSVYLPACLGEDAAGTQPAGTDTPAQPQPTPMTWVSRGKTDDNTGKTASDANKEKAGVTDAEIVDTLEKYYADCKEKLEKAGTGDVHFNNVVPETLWSTIERAYSTGAQWDGYVNEALKALGAENFVIQLQVQRLGGGYYRIYHNIYTD